MKTWFKFITIPFILLIIIYLVSHFSNFEFSSASVFSLLFVVFQFLVFIIIPYSMLRLAPKYPYIATLSYMAILWAIIYLTQFTKGSQGFYQESLYFILCFIFWTITAITIYTFYDLPRFQIKKHHVDHGQSNKA